jgi:hypothetical protein
VVPLAAAGTTLGMLALLVARASAVAADVLFQALWLVLLALRAAVWSAAAVFEYRLDVVYAFERG